ncbi:MAG: cupredoxin domain-containing protein [Chloroflexota bacterium]|nr:cupredoxin domain-containing protein [Chloroflexota bacterium]MDE3193138.1 cupredoxin domain-containing protein [Chloroflexota bacterium]
MPRQHSGTRASDLWRRAIVFGALALGLIAAAVYSLAPKETALVDAGGAGTAASAPTLAPGTTAAADVTIRIDMAGFHPSQLAVPADRAVRLMILNPDSSHHSDGGGIHELAVPSLGVDVKVPPETRMLVTLPASAAGEYSFYCDTCCGGKENPTMQGVLKVG